MDHIGPTEASRFMIPCKKNIFDIGGDDFHAFPDKAGWALNDEKCEFEAPTQSRSDRADFETFIQSWLFFGLLDTVLYLGPTQRIETKKFRKEGFITTECLNKYLEDWETSEVKSTGGQTMRMIRAQVALDKARQIVRKYCSMDEMDSTPGVRRTFQIGDKIALSLMVLGETLAAAKAKVVERVGFSVRGWHGDATQGWGTPKIIVEEMRRDEWCKRTVFMLRGQLKSHASALLAAYMSHPKSHRTSLDHAECTEKKCKKKAQDSMGKYETKHTAQCTDRDCQMIGPEMDKVIQAIEENKIPLLRFSNAQGDLQIDVEPADPHKIHEYSTISHVWSDGYGNMKVNKLWKCQLMFFRSLFREAQPDPTDVDEETDFWIDTLAIPVEPEYKNQRTKAIRQIYEIYTRAKYTIVIDNGLREMTPEHGYEKIAMKILASGWMRRLWTLQEAYLSEHVLFAFEDDKLIELDHLEKRFRQAHQNLASNIPEAARNYFHNLLGQERKERIHSLRPTSSVRLVASVWRAAHWRTTAHPEHEVLALATLLRLVNRSTTFAEAGLLPDQQKQRDAKEKDQKLEEMMKELWLLLEEVYPGSIPPGVVFLPGKKLSIDGFKWAPKTWMIGQELDDPDPLSSLRQPAVIEADLGLCVYYPGFILHATNPRNTILPKENFSFPTDNTLQEWYTASRADDAENDQPYAPFNEQPEFAIILSRERPRQIAEIALLVEIVRRSPPREFDAQHTPTTYHVLIVTRVRVNRAIERDRNFNIASRGQEDKIICGEVLNNDQRWYVGGSRHSKRVEASGTSSTPDPNQGASTSAFEPRRMPEGNDKGPQRAPNPQKKSFNLKKASTWIPLGRAKRTFSGV